MSDEAADREAAAIAAAVRSVAHRTRVRALFAFTEREMSPTELLRLINDPELTLPNLSYHVRTMAKAGLIDLAGATPRRGAMEHHYALTPLGGAVAQALEHIAVATRSHHFTRRPDHHPLDIES